MNTLRFLCGGVVVCHALIIYMISAFVKGTQQQFRLFSQSNLNSYKSLLSKGLRFAGRGRVTVSRYIVYAYEANNVPTAIRPAANANTQHVAGTYWGQLDTMRNHRRCRMFGRLAPKHRRS